MPNPELAIQEYLAAIRIDPAFVKAHVDLGVLYLKQNAFANAESHFRQAIEIDPQSDLAHFNLGLFYGISGQIEPAIAEFSQTLALAPDNPEVLIELGKAYYKKPDYHSAMEVFRQVIQLDPQFVAANYYLGVIFRRQNLPDSAAIHWQVVTLNQEPYFKDVKQLAFKQLGELALIKKDFIAAGRYFSQAVELNVKNTNPDVLAGIWGGFGKASFFQNHFEPAIAQLSTAINFSPQQPEPHYYLGLAFQALQKFPESIAEFEKVIQCDPNGAFGKTARENLTRLMATK